MPGFTSSETFAWMRTSPRAEKTCFHHVSEYLAAAAPACHPKAERTWLPFGRLRTYGAPGQKRLKRGAAPPVLQAMRGHEEAEGTPEDQAPVLHGLP